ncbi:MAG TPA: hypothetical protein DD405_04830 [Desulfobacteraceae bacterium]|nr:hypothetical protein [Desulfobacteraceae bacterium]
MRILPKCILSQLNLKIKPYLLKSLEFLNPALVKKGQSGPADLFLFFIQPFLYCSLIVAR